MNALDNYNDTLSNVFYGDCLEVMKGITNKSIDMVYLDPPFFTNRKHTLTSPDRKSEYSFDDIWDSHKTYADFMAVRLAEIHRILKDTGSVFLHCDKTANHILRLVASEIFGEMNFRSEIIWSYKRWSNSSNNLTPNHQTILFFSKTENYKFNKTYTDYSETTNVDQILQKRARDIHGKAIYAREAEGNTVASDDKKGVPLSDVWDIPFLNPKAKERTGYPTQKPILLLERIINLVTDVGDVVFDPFCGSGTTLVAAKLQNRKYIGVDVSQEAVDLTKSRLTELVKTNSALLKNGRLSYVNADEKSIALLAGLDVVPVHRNTGIDAILKKNYLSAPVPIKVQRENESVFEAMTKLTIAAQKKGAKIAFLVVIDDSNDLINDYTVTSGFVKIIQSTALLINKFVV